MSAFDLEEQEQLAELKAWWQRYGNLLITGITLALLVFAAWNGWKWYQRTQAGNAAALYGELQKAAGTSDTKKVRELAGNVLEQFPGTAYAPLAALISAKAYFDAGDLKAARVQLQWVVDKARDPELQAIGRLRLASVLLDDKAYDDALKVLAVTPDPAFEGLFADLRGDVLAVQGKKSDARTAYKAALDKVKPADAASRDFIQFKIDALGEG